MVDTTRPEFLNYMFILMAINVWDYELFVLVVLLTWTLVVSNGEREREREITQ